MQLTQFPGLFRTVSSHPSHSLMHQSCCIPSLCLLDWWVSLMFGSSLSLSVILTVATLSFTDGENHWRASVRSIGGQSCYDQWCSFTAPGASDWRGKGAVDFIRAQLDFTLVCVLCICVCVCKSWFESVALTRSSCRLSQFAPECVCSSIHTCLPGWVAAWGLWLNWTAFWRSHWVAAQTRCSQGK